MGVSSSTELTFDKLTKGISTPGNLVSKLGLTAWGHSNTRLLLEYDFPKKNVISPSSK